MSTIKKVVITNETGEVLTSAVVEKGNDYSEYSVTRIFAAIDIGDDAGKTHDQTDPSVGCLVAQFKGAPIKAVSELAAYHPGVIRTTAWNTQMMGTANQAVVLSWRTAFNEKTKIASLYILDTGTDGATQLVEDDYIEVEVQLGNS